MEPELVLRREIDPLAHSPLVRGLVLLMYYADEQGAIRLTKSGGMQAAIFLNLLPICTMIGDRLFYAEPFGAAKMIGTVAVVTGVVLVISRRRR